MALEDILKGIEEKVSVELEKIKKEAQEKEKEILKEKEKEALRIKNEILKSSEKEVEIEERQRIIKVRREEKMLNLRLKRKVLDDAFDLAKKKFLYLPRENYLQLLKKTLLNHIDSSTEEIIVNLEDEKWLKKELLKEKNMKNKLKITPRFNEHERGFILRKKEIQINYTLSSLFLFLRKKLEIEVARKLFN